MVQNRKKEKEKAIVYIPLGIGKKVILEIVCNLTQMLENSKVTTVETD